MPEIQGGIGVGDCSLTCNHGFLKTLPFCDGHAKRSNSVVSMAMPFAKVVAGPTQIMPEIQGSFAIGDASKTHGHGHGHPKPLPFSDGYGTSRSKAAVFVAMASQKVVAAFAREGCNDSVNKVANSRRGLQSKGEDCLAVDSKAGSDGSLSSLTSVTSGHVNSPVFRPSMALSSPTEDVATLHLTSKSPAIGNSMGIQALPPQKLLRVAVDVDEVLGSFLSSLNTFIAEQHFLKHNISEYNVYDFMKIWRCSQAEANDLVHAFFESEHFKDGILPIPGAHESLLQLAEFCHLVVVTSRQHVIKNQTLDWIERHYSGIFSDVYFGNHFALEGEARPKSEICRSIGAQVLIDDNPRYAVECAQHDIEVLLFDYNNSYPWSKTPDGPVHPLITRVQSWQEVEFSLLACAYEKR